MSAPALPYVSTVTVQELEELFKESIPCDASVIETGKPCPNSAVYKVRARCALCRKTNSYNLCETDIYLIKNKLLACNVHPNVPAILVSSVKL